MSQNEPRDRFKNAGETYKGTRNGSEDQQQAFRDDQDVQEDQEGQDNTQSQSDQDVTDEQEEQDGDDEQQQGDIRQRRESFQAYVPAKDKETVESTWRKVKVLCNLAEQPEPKKNDFYTAIIRVGYSDLEAIARELDLSEAFADHRELVE